MAECAGCGSKARRIDRPDFSSIVDMAAPFLHGRPTGILRCYCVITKAYLCSFSVMDERSTKEPLVNTKDVCKDSQNLIG